MIFGNRANEIGDIVLIVARAPIIGVISLTGFTTDVEGETIERYFYKEFSYSIDGLFFTPFQELTITNLESIQISNTDTFYINYKYTRQGLYDDGVLIFNSVTLLGEFNQPLCDNYFILPKSIFRDIFCYNPEHLGLCVVLTKKCYEEGIVPKFLIRNQNSNAKIEDKDYIDFWDAVCCFYALMIVFARKFQNYGRIKEMLILYLTQFSHFICLDMDMSVLTYIKDHQYNEIKKRGTTQIFNQQALGSVIDGEFLRMICHNPKDELIIANVASHWLVDINCPLSGGFINHASINKITTTLPIDTTYGTINQNIVDDTQIAIIELVDDGFICGFNRVNNSNFLKVNQAIDYQLKFDISTEILNEAIISCGIIAYDQYDNILQCQNINNGSMSNNFFQRISLPINDKFYTISCILFNSQQELLINSLPNINIGSNLRLPVNVCKIHLKIVLDRSTNEGSMDSKLTIKNINFEPLVSGNRVNKKKYIVSAETEPAIPMYLNYIWHNTTNNRYFYYNQTLSIWSESLNLQKDLVDLQSKAHYQNHSFLDREQVLALYYKNNNANLSASKLEQVLKQYLLDYSLQPILTQLA